MGDWLLLFLKDIFPNNILAEIDWVDVDQCRFFFNQNTLMHKPSRR